ncbi:hypothetical protein B0J17DRAFT_630654 [Rhizoctonia solani]|nr:hypothetical protein B0J17DRAFT_630654 [Rhizoctonia solani]
MTSYPYPLIPTPPGDWKNDIYDLHAIRMAAIHNIFIRAFNSVFYHAPKVGSKEVPGFMKYCNAIILYTNITPLKKRPFFQLWRPNSEKEQWTETWHSTRKLCKKIAAKETKYNETDFLSLFRASADILYCHFVDEILAMESSRLKKHFNEAELQDIENNIDKKAQEIALLWNAPLILVNSDLSFNSWFPPVPAPITFVARHVLMNCMGDMWTYGQCDKYMRLKDEFKSMYGL